MFIGLVRIGPATQWGVSLWRFHLWGDCTRGLDRALLTSTNTPAATAAAATAAAATVAAATAAAAAGAAAAGAAALDAVEPAATLGVVQADAAAAKAHCQHMKLSYRVEPGQSWGRLSDVQIAEWKARRCDQFYCRPSPMEAVGQYRCVPL